VQFTASRVATGNENVHRRRRRSAAAPGCPAARHLSILKLDGQLAVMSEISWCDAGASAGQPEIVATLLRCCGRGSLAGVSYDFAVIPVDLITSPEQAARLHVAMCEEVKQPAPRDVEEFVAELHRKYGFDNDENPGSLP